MIEFVNDRKFQKDAVEKIHLLCLFKQDLVFLYEDTYSLNDARQLANRIRQNINLVRDILAETYCLKLISSNPNSKKGIVVRDCDPFDFILNTPHYEVSFIPEVIEMIDKSIAVLNKAT